MRFLFVLCLTALIAVFSVDAGAAVQVGASVVHSGATLHHVLVMLGLGGVVFGTTLGTSNLTLADWAKRLDPDGKVPTIVELLSQTNDILKDMVLVEGNLPVGTRTSIRTGLPAVYWRLLNRGVAPSKSTTATVDEQSGMLEAWSEVDTELAKLNGNINAFRLSEAGAFLEAMNQEMAQTLFYGNSSLSPEEFTGLSARYSDSTAGNGSNVIKAGGAGGDNASMWLVVWGQNTTHCIFPKGSTAGLIHEDKGEQIVYSGTGLGQERMMALVERYQWKNGLVVKDWRYVVRVCNIDISNLVSESSAADLQKCMVKAVHRIPNMKGGRAAWYVNRTVAEFLDIQEIAKIADGGGTTDANVQGMPVQSFRGIPIRSTDALLETESLVS